MINILSWNIRQGGGRRVLGIIQALVGSEAHIIVLSEFHNNRNGSQIQGYLEKAKYHFQYITKASANRNSVFIASKFPAKATHFPNYDPNYPYNIIKLELGAFYLFGMYLPHKKKHRLFDLLIEQVQVSKPSILVGDFNTGKNYIDQKKSSFWYTDQLKQLESKGMMDAFRLKNGDLREYSWYSHQGNGYRYDHTYISEDLHSLVDDCFYLHDWRESGLSDHSPMMLTLKP